MAPIDEPQPTEKPSHDTHSTVSPICDFYAGKSVLVTGATGFLGKLLVEKLLRTTQVGCVYLLVREKKGQSVAQRLNQIKESVVFDLVRPHFATRVRAISGDCSYRSLALSPTDRLHLQQTVHIVFHVAATVRFDENLKLAYAINVQGTGEVLALCAQARQLEALVHVSTAYSNCPLGEIEERVYTVDKVDYVKLGAALDRMTRGEADKLAKRVLAPWPNTYTFTKALAETLVREEAGDVPVAIFRPAIVISTYAEPLEGWIDNYYGPTGACAGGATGLLRVFLCDKDAVADIVPADKCVSGMIATAWDLACNKRHKQRQQDRCVTTDSCHVKPDGSYVKNDKCHFKNDTGVENDSCVRNVKNDRNIKNDRYGRNDNNDIKNNSYIENDSLVINDSYVRNDTSHVKNDTSHVKNDSYVKNDRNVENVRNRKNESAHDKYVKNDSFCRNDSFDSTVPVYNYVSSVENPVTWDEYNTFNAIYGKKYPTSKMLWGLHFTDVKDIRWYFVFHFFLHIIPALLVDLVRLVLGQKPMLVPLYGKFHKYTKLVGFFATRQWRFRNDNVRAMWAAMDDTDRRLFPLSMATVDWLRYFRICIKGLRVYLLKDGLETLPVARRRQKRLELAHNMLVLLFYFLLGSLVWSVLGHVIGLVTNGARLFTTFAEEATRNDTTCTLIC